MHALQLVETSTSTSLLFGDSYPLSEVDENVLKRAEHKPELTTMQLGAVTLNVFTYGAWRAADNTKSNPHYTFIGSVLPPDGEQRFDELRSYETVALAGCWRRPDTTPLARGCLVLVTALESVDVEDKCRGSKTDFKVLGHTNDYNGRPLPATIRHHFAPQDRVLTPLETWNLRQNNLAAAGRPPEDHTFTVMALERRNALRPKL